VQVDEEQDAVPACPGARRRRPGELEGEVLALLHWASGSVTAGWVHERLDAALAYTAVVTILTRLQAKHAVARIRCGRSFRWTATVDEGGLASRRMRRMLDGESDRHAVLTRFVAELSPDDEQALRRRLERTGPSSAQPAGACRKTDRRPGQDSVR
jgi:predicted transcriptional regulator